ncbi:MAG: NAD(+) synthase [Paludibacter sp.]|jgi:NAD+ synthase (glutamine-hydrolysing)|nr:NAD(+) synthase [Paludibacter sp.]
MKHGYIRIAAAIPEVRVSDCRWNVLEMGKLIDQAIQQQVEIITFPELSVTAYTCGDLFFQQKLLNQSLEALQQLLLKSSESRLIIIAGMPVLVDDRLFNVAVVLQSGNILGIVPKTHLPNHNEFYEKRWFAAATEACRREIQLNGQLVAFGTDLLFEYGEAVFGIEICEDLWVPQPPSTQAAMQGATLIFNLSATNELAGKNAYLRQIIGQQSARTHTGYVYASAGIGESSTDLVYTGNGIIAENGQLIAVSERFKQSEQLVVSEIDIEKLKAERLRNTNFFSERSPVPYRRIRADYHPVDFGSMSRKIHPHPFVPETDKRSESCEEIFAIQAAGLAQRWRHTGAQTLVLGISGGLDSTLALLVSVKAADLLGYQRERILGITMPGFGTTGRTYANAVQLIKSLGVSFREISIKEACLQHFSDIGHDASVHDVTYENTQARERTQLLMDIANQTGGLVVGTGDLSELALGWATYNGDHMSMYGVNSGVPKTLVRYLVDWASQKTDEVTRAVLQDILATPVSPELLPAGDNDSIQQKTEDIVGPYELHDFFLYYMIRFGFSPEKILYLAKQAFSAQENETNYDEATIQKWLKIFLKRFYNQQFKRSCMPDGPKVGSINLSPRGDWRMPSDASFTE